VGYQPAELQRPDHVTGTSHPAIANVDFSALLTSSSITINAVGAVNGPVTILTSTNLLLPVASWTTVTSTTFDGSGNLSQSISVDLHPAAELLPAAGILNTAMAST